MAFGSKGRIEELEAENASLKQWVEYLKGTEPIQLAEQVQQYRSQLTGVEQQVLQARAARRHPERARRCARPIVVTEERALLQEVGIYEYRHPLDDVVAYKDQLAQTKDTLKTMVRNNQAADSAHLGQRFQCKPITDSRQAISIGAKRRWLCAFVAE